MTPLPPLALALPGSASMRWPSSTASRPNSNAAAAIRIRVWALPVIPLTVLPLPSFPIAQQGRFGHLLGLLALLHRAPRHLDQRPEPLAQRLQAVAVAAVEDLRRGADRVGELAVVWLPPQIPCPAGLPGELLNVHALVEAELGVGAPQAGVLHSAPRALAGAVGEGVVVDPDHPGLDLVRHPL